MDLEPLTLVATSAILHALWNFMAKGSLDKEVYIWLLNFTSVISFLPLYYLLLPNWSFPWNALPYLIISAAAETIYFLALGRAYTQGDLSLVYPLVRSSPLFVAVLATVFLEEKLTLFGILGILVILIGVYVLHLKSLKTGSFLKVFQFLRNTASLFALIAAIGTTVYSLSDKVGVTVVNPVLYSFWLDWIILCLLTSVMLYRRSWYKINSEWKDSKLKITISGFLMKGGYLLVLVAMNFAQVSYILALRQVSVVFGVILGVLLLKEKYGTMRLLGSILIFMGAYILGVLT